MKFSISIVNDEGTVVDEIEVFAEQPSNLRDAIESGLEEEGYVECDDCGAYIHIDAAIEKGSECFCEECEE